MNLKKHLLPLATLALIGCGGDLPSDETSTGENNVSCRGAKCDSTELEVPALSPIALDRLIECDLTRDTSTPDEFFQSDTMSCRYTPPASDEVGLQIVILELRRADGQYVGSELWRTDQLAGAFEHTFRGIRSSHYPLQLRARYYWQGKGFGLSGDIDAPRNELFGTASHAVWLDDIARPASTATLAPGPALELWPITLWPTTALESAWQADEHSFWLGELRGQTMIPREANVTDTSINFLFPYGHGLTARAQNESLTPLSQLHLYLPVALGTSPDAMLMTRWDSGQPRATPITQPGYYLLELDGSVTPATPEQVRERGARQTAPAPVIDTPDMERDLQFDFGSDDADMSDLGDGDLTDVDMSAQEDMSLADMPPVDPCMGSCTVSQVCVAGACVKRDEQYQASSCNTPTRACDAGEDDDCASGHACVAGLCRRLACQYQPSSCNTASQPCEQNDQCSDGHACVEGLCRRLACQYQPSSCNTASQPCDAGEDSDCSSDHACVAGLCRRLACQYQPSSCNTATQPCEQDAHCAPDHTCNAAGACERNSCM